MRLLPLLTAPLAIAAMCASCATRGDAAGTGTDTGAAVSTIPDTAAMEQRFADIAFKLELSGEAERQRGAREYLRQAEHEPGGIALAAGIADRYLFDPESPVYSETLYIPFLEYLIATGRDTTGLLAGKLAICRRNAPGAKAPDFAYRTPGGGGERLIAPGSEADIILFFHDPDCPRCQAMASAMRSSRTIGTRLADGSLRVAAVDLSLNPEVEADTLYEIRATPAVYLLRADGTVVLKDPSAPRLAAELSRRVKN